MTITSTKQAALALNSLNEDEKDSDSSLQSLINAALAIRESMGFPPLTFDSDEPICDRTGREKQRSREVTNAATRAMKTSLTAPIPPERDFSPVDEEEKSFDLSNQVSSSAYGDWSSQFLEISDKFFYKGEKERRMEDRSGISSYLDLSNAALALLEPYLEPHGDPIVRSAAETLLESLQYYETRYDLQRKLLEEVIDHTLIDINFLEANNFNFSVRSESLEPMCQQMQEDLLRIQERTNEMTLFSLTLRKENTETSHLLDIFVDQIEGTESILVPDYFNPDFNSEDPPYLEISREGEWKERLEVISRFYEVYAWILNQHNHYTEEYLTRVQELRELLDTGSQLLKVD